MRRGAVPAALGAALAALALVGVASSSGEPSRRPVGSTHLQVTEVEYRLLLSRGEVMAGAVALEDIDGGMDPHDLRLRRGRDGALIAVPLLAPGQRWDGVVHLRPGVYHLWCSLPQHWKLGMRATLRVAG